MKPKKAAILIFLFFSITSFAQQILPGASRIDAYMSLVQNKKVALVGNHTSTIGKVHLLDTLLKRGVNVKLIFGPEHGFRGQADAGERIRNEYDAATEIRIISLYGRHHKPKPADLEDIDCIIFDIQDVGARFFTYLSTLHYIMEACAENNKDLIVLDRPNPNGNCIDGPVLDLKYKSFVGLDPVPILYGMTIGEYAQMINGEGWLKNGVHCNLTVISCENYTHASQYELPQKPSPNLPNTQAIKLYASLALFEGTIINVGRGTDFPFQVFGHPQLDSSNIQYKPEARPGAMTPPHKDTVCKGIDLRNFESKNINCLNLQWLIFAYKHFPEKNLFFNKFFFNLSGNGDLKNQIVNGTSEEEIRKSWQKELDNFKAIRKKYLLYN